MTIQLVGNQLVDSIITESKLDDNAVAYAKIKSSDIETSLSGGASKLASAAAIKSYVDGQVQTYTGGNGIAIDGSNVISADLASTPGLQFTSNKLDVKVKSESGGSLTKDADGLYLADSAIGNAKLANSTISGVALGANLNALTLAANSGMTMTSYNGSAAVSDLSLVLDGGTLAKSASGVKVADTGIDTAQLANNAVTEAKVSFSPQIDSVTPNGSAKTFDLTNTIASGFEIILVFRNGVCVKQVESSPSGVDQFILNRTAGAGGVSQIEFGSAPAASQDIRAFYLA
jgi:hypothetical protein